MFDTVCIPCYICHMDIRVRNLTPEQHKALKILAAERETNVNQIMLQLIREYIERERGKK